MRTYMEEYNYWLASEAVDEKTKEELRSIAGNEAEIEGRFKAMLTFGTAGLRGTMKAGIANMNVYTVRYATQGFANLIRAKGRRGFYGRTRCSDRPRLKKQFETVCMRSSVRTGGQRHQVISV